MLFPVVIMSFILLHTEGVPSKIMEFLHVKPGKGSAFVRTKVKNLLNGSVQERTFRAGESVVAADISKTEMQFTYKDDGELALCILDLRTLVCFMVNVPILFDTFVYLISLFLLSS